MQTLDWSVETLGRECSSTGLCIHFYKTSERNMSDTVLYLVAVVTRLLSSSHRLFPVVVTSLGQVIITLLRVDDGDRLAITCSNKTNMDSTIACHQRAGDTRLVGTTFCKSVGLINLVIKR